MFLQVLSDNTLIHKMQHLINKVLIVSHRVGGFINIKHICSESLWHDIIHLIARLIINENLISSFGSRKVYLIYQNDSAMLQEWIYEAINRERRPLWKNSILYCRKVSCLEVYCADTQHIDGGMSNSEQFVNSGYLQLAILMLEHTRQIRYFFLFSNFFLRT